MPPEPPSFQRFSPAVGGNFSPASCCVPKITVSYRADALGCFPSLCQRAQRGVPQGGTLLVFSSSEKGVSPRKGTGSIERNGSERAQGRERGGGEAAREHLAPGGMHVWIRCRIYEMNRLAPGPLFLSPRAAACREDLLPEADRLRRHLDQLVLVDEFDRLLQRHDPGGNQAQRLVGPRRADVGKLLLLGRVDVHVHGARVLPD